MGDANDTEPPDFAEPSPPPGPEGGPALVPPTAPPPVSDKPRELPVVPVPPPEPSRPPARRRGLALLLVGIALALLAGGGWYIFFVWK